MSLLDRKRSVQPRMQAPSAVDADFVRQSTLHVSMLMRAVCAHAFIPSSQPASHGGSLAPPTRASVPLSARATAVAGPNFMVGPPLWAEPPASGSFVPNATPVPARGAIQRPAASPFAGRSDPAFFGSPVQVRFIDGLSSPADGAGADADQTGRARILTASLPCSLRALAGLCLFAGLAATAPAAAAGGPCERHERRPRVERARHPRPERCHRRLHGGRRELASGRRPGAPATRLPQHGRAAAA